MAPDSGVEKSVQVGLTYISICGRLFIFHNIIKDTVILKKSQRKNKSAGPHKRGIITNEVRINISTVYIYCSLITHYRAIYLNPKKEQV